MQSGTVNMTKGSPVSLIVRFSIPLVLGNLCQQLYTIVDSIIVGQGVGLEALSSLGASDWLNWFFLWMIAGLTQGFAIRTAQYFGAGDMGGVRRSITMSALLSLVMGLVFMVTALLCAHPILRLLKTPGTSMEGALEYLQVIFGGFLCATAYNMASSILRSLGDSKAPLVAMVIATVANIGLDLLFVLVFDFGIRGAAVATVVAQGISFVYCLRKIQRLSMLEFAKEDWKVDGKLCGELFRLGMPVAFSMGTITIGGMIVQSVVNLQGYLFVAAITATNKLHGIMVTVSNSFAFGVSTYMSQNYGAQNMDRLKAGMHRIVPILLAVSAVLTASMLIFGHNLLGMFIAPDQEGAAQVLAIAYHYLCIMSIFLSALYLLNLYRGALQGIGRTGISSISGIIETALRVFVALLCTRLWGTECIFYTEICAWIGAAVYLIVCFHMQLHCLGKGWRPLPSV